MKRFFGQNARCLVVSMTIALGARETRDQHVGAKRPNDANHVRESDVMAAPFGESFIGVLGKPEISDTRESVLYTVMLVGGEKFLGSQHAKNVGQITTNLVLAALAAIQRHQQCGNAVTAGLKGQETAVFIVRMRHDLHQSRGSAKAQKLEA
jgi:hypothetical protein